MTPVALTLLASRREMRGRVLFLLGATVFASLVGFGFSRIGGGSGSGTTLKVDAAADVRGVTTTTSSQSASVGYDGPAICAPTTDAATSGGSPQELTSSASEVATGTIEGKAWSLWSSHGQTGAVGLEDGGLVFDGREYGLCPGYPNPSETEMIDTGGDAIIYGVVDYPGLAKVQISTGSINSFAVGTVLPSPHASVVNGVSFYIGTLPQPACSYNYFEVNTTSPSYSAEHNIGFGENGIGLGYSITNDPGNIGACVTGKLDPLSYSEGIWQLPPGQFQGNVSGGSVSTGSGSGSGSGASSVNVPNDTSTCSSTTNPSSSGGPPSTITSTGTEVASGTVGGEAWSLWSAKGQSGADGIENGGLVLDGRAYGLCPGYPNPAELQLIDVGSEGVVAGIVGYPGLSKIALSESSVGTFDVGQALPSPAVQVVDGVSFFIGTLPESACDYPSLELNTTSPGVSAEHNLGFGTCVANELVPITESQGIWQLPPGQFQTSLGGQSSASVIPTTPPTPTLPPAGSQPSDPAAQAAVETAFQTVYGQGAPNQKLQLLQGGPNQAVVAAGDAAAQKYPQISLGSTPKVLQVVFTDPTDAAVLYEIDYEGKPTVGPKIGYAVLDGGTWMVTRATYCGDIDNSGTGVTC